MLSDARPSSMLLRAMAGCQAGKALKFLMQAQTAPTGAVTTLLR